MNPFQSYRRVQISTADPTRIIVLLYEGAISNLQTTLRALGKDEATASAKLGRTQEIINYLRNALDHEKGGEIATNLERLYEYMRDKLNEAIIQRAAAPIEEVIGLLGVLLEGWRGIAEQQATTDHDAAPDGMGEGEPADAARRAPSLSFIG